MTVQSFKAEHSARAVELNVARRPLMSVPAFNGAHTSDA
jgi:hypothetical protein